MPAPAGTSTALRLARIAALVLGSLLFLYACENSKSALLADKWVEVAISGGLLAAGLGAAWFEIKLTDYGEEPSRGRGDARIRGSAGARRERTSNTRGPAREFLVESEGWSMRARIGRSGDLIFHGHDLGGTYPAYEWMWIFHPDTFPDIRAALGDETGDILELLEEVVPQLDRHGRHDPGAWLRTHDIPATYREKGVSATQETRKLPIMRPGLPASRRGDSGSARGRRNEQAGKRSRSATRGEVPLGDATPMPAGYSASARSRRDPDVPAESRHEDAMPARAAHDEPEPGRSQWPSAAPSRKDFGLPRSPYADAAPHRSRWEGDAVSAYEEPAPSQSMWQNDAGYAASASRSRWAGDYATGYAEPTPPQSMWQAEPEPNYEAPGPVGLRWDAPTPPYDDPLPAQPVRQPEPAPRYDEPSSAQPIWQAEPAPRYNEPLPAQPAWQPEPTPRYDEPPSAQPVWQPEPAPRYNEPIPAQQIWQPEPAPRYNEPRPAQPLRQPEPAPRYDELPSAQPVREPAPRYEEPAPRWPVREEVAARPPLERRKRSRSTQPASEWSRQDDSADYEDAAETRARRQRLDAIQSRLESSIAPPEQPHSYRGETSAPHYDSRRYEADDFPPLQRRGSSVVPHDYPAAQRYEQPAPQRPSPTAGPSWPERSMPRRRQPPPASRDEPPRQREEYTRSWDDRPQSDQPPARRRRSSPPPDPASGRHAASQGATPPWP